MNEAKDKVYYHSNVTEVSFVLRGLPKDWGQENYGQLLKNSIAVSILSVQG